MKVIMFHKLSHKNEPKPIPLTKGQSSFKKLEKEMNKPPSEYEAIKKLVENNENNDIKNINNKSSKSNNLKLLPHKKK